MKRMRVAVAILACVAFSLLTACVSAPESPRVIGETKVTIGNGISGTLVRPATSGRVPAVLMLHGFASSKDEVGGMYKRLAASLAAHGVASLRIDFRGWGESSGDMADSTIGGHVADAEAAYAFLASVGFVDVARMGVMGFSMGGGVAIIVGGNHPSWFKSMAAWSPVGNYAKDFADKATPENRAKAIKDGVVEIDLGWRKVSLKNGFFTSLDTYDVQAIITHYPGALLAVAGSKDFSAAYVDGFVKDARDVRDAKGSPMEAWIVPGGDHIFGVLGPDQAMAESVIKKTVDWFGKTL